MRRDRDTDQKIREKFEGVSKDVHAEDARKQVTDEPSREENDKDQEERAHDDLRVFAADNLTIMALSQGAVLSRVALSQGFIYSVRVNYFDLSSSIPYMAKEKKLSIHPTGDRVLVMREDKPEKKLASGIILPETAEKEKSKRGIVVAIGPGRLNDEGRLIPTTIKVGAKVYFNSGWDNEVDVGEDDEEFFLV